MENPEILHSSRMSIKMKNKLKRRRSSLPSSRAVAAGRRVKTLKELIPSSHECVGADALFTKTADYILLLQLKVQVMQTMIDLLSSNSDGH
uniref:Uncharacterized protein n=1 Tax=Kalanchoe fedtschenkoi TaxID=63787 RepID=A0A7N0VCD1_KALFE